MAKNPILCAYRIKRTKYVCTHMYNVQSLYTHPYASTRIGPITLCQNSKCIIYLVLQYSQ